MTQHPMQQFHDLVANILDNGIRESNRTGIDTLSLPGQVLRFDLRDGFPAITTKKLAFKSAVGELIGFMRGYLSAAQFRQLGCKVWDANANTTPSWLANPYRAECGGEDQLGRIYSAQWTDWRDWRAVHSFGESQALIEQGYELIAEDFDRSTYVLRRGINQLEEVLTKLLTNPTDRRKVITGWRPDEWDQAALPSCHTEYAWQCDTVNRVLHMTMQMRSFDVGLGFNVTLCGLMLAIMAKLSGFTPGSFVMLINDAHIYVNHVDGMREMLSREHYPQPTLHLGDSIPTLTSADQVRGVFTRIQPDDIKIPDYVSHPRIVLPMAA
ncbi:thymidylate synthase [Paraburkholderia sp. EG287A]|uniref:thymidylate synthase n=1 Tax=Paraburkholderia sp. EG287A TaxID=3237012 RepID=UPI0034D31545